MKVAGIKGIRVIMGATKMRGAQFSATLNSSFDLTVASRLWGPCAEKGPQKSSLFAATLSLVSLEEACQGSKETSKTCHSWCYF